MSAKRNAAAEADEPRDPRYVVGIDLGTTNSAVAYVDTVPKRWRVESFRVLQVTAPSEAEALETLPSFHYEPAPGEFAGGGLRLPWQQEDPAYAVGAFAHDHGAEVPGRLVNSAKSWLSHAGVDRTAALLPWHGAPDVTKLSPVAVSARILTHVRQAWDAHFPDAPLAEQDVVVTVPASFDEIARELTVQAVRQAELPRVTLIEEPQAAFYAWIAHQGDDWRRQLEPGQTVLVCDVGGGTTDLTLIEVRESATGEVALHRVAVGEHLILGGDNLDLALAHHVEARIGGGTQLDAAVWSVLVRRCQRAKEELFGIDPPEELTLHLPGGGSRLIGGGRQVTLGRGEVLELLLDGFLPRVALDEHPDTTRTGFQEFGLPYAADPAITRHLAAFLARGQDGATVRPDLLLFNGGLFESPATRERVVDVLSAWFGGAERSWSPRLLDHDRLALAVSRGAAYYGMARRGKGVRISSGLARSYYVGVDRQDQDDRALPAAICLVPAGLEEGQHVELDREFELRIQQPVEFPLYVSGARTNDRSGDIVDADPEQLRALPPIRTVMRAGKQAKRDTTRVHLLAGLSEIGTLETRCREADGSRSWTLQFDVRSATRTDLEGHTGAGELAGLLDEREIDAARARLREAFTATKPPQQLMRDLEKQLGMSRGGWPPALLRRLWEELLEIEPLRLKTVTHESRWLNLVGYALRPGYGVALDDWRVARTWRLAPQGLAHDKNEACRAEWWILWRRLAGGMTSGQQVALAEPLLSALRGWSKNSKAKVSSGRVSFRGGSHETAEVWRLLGSLELLASARKIELGTVILDEIAKRGPGVWNHAGVWALGRLGARVPQYGPLNTVMPTETAETWIEALIGNDPGKSGVGDELAFAIVQLARRTGDRYRDLAPELRSAVLEWMERHDVREHYRRLVAEGGELEADEQRRAFGEALPAGIRLL